MYEHGGSSNWRWPVLEPVLLGRPAAPAPAASSPSRCPTRAVLSVRGAVCMVLAVGAQPRGVCMAGPADSRCSCRIGRCCRDMPDALLLLLLLLPSNGLRSCCYPAICSACPLWLRPVQLPLLLDGAWMAWLLAGVVAAVGRGHVWGVWAVQAELLRGCRVRAVGLGAREVVVQELLVGGEGWVLLLLDGLQRVELLERVGGEDSLAGLVGQRGQGSSCSRLDGSNPRRGECC